MGKFLLSSGSKEALIVQSNKLVEARYSLSIHEQRIILMMLSMIRKEDKDFHIYKIPVSDFLRITGLKNKNIYRKIKETLVNLDSKRFTIEKEDGYLTTGWTSDIEYKGKEGMIEISFSPKLKPYLLDLKSKFTSYQLDTVIHFKTSMSIRIYTLLKQYEKIGERRFEIKTLKEILDINEKSYPVYQDFKRRIIIPAQKEFSQKDDEGNYKSDLGFDFSPIKTGRKTTAIKFNIIKFPKKEEKIKIVSPANDKKVNLSYYGLSEEDVIQLRKEYPEDELIRCSEILDDGIRRKKIKNPAGYYLKLIKSGAGKISEYENDKAEKEKKHILNEDKEKKIVKLSKEFLKKRVAEFVGSLSLEERENLTENVLKAYEGRIFETELIKNTGLSDPIIRLEITKHIPKYEEEKEAYIKSKL